MIVTHKKTYCKILGIAFLFLSLLPLHSQGTVRTHMSLQELANNLSATVFWDPLSGIAVLEKNGHLANFRAGDALVLLDYREAVILDPPVMQSASLMVSTS